MGWDNRRYDEIDRSGGLGGRVRAWFGRVFGPGASFLDWSITLYRAWGIRVRLHLFFILMVVSELLTAGRGVGVLETAVGMVTLFGLVLLHEYGHCLACRRVGGEADDIVLWPLGGLASCRPPHDWRADLITTLGGPGVNAVLAPVFGGVLVALGQGGGAVVFNPFDPAPAISQLGLADGSRPAWLVAVWMAHYTNLLLLAFNMLVPMYPMDGARTVQALLWRSIGYARSMQITVTLGLATAVVLGVASMVTGESRLLGLALFGGITCWMERQRLAQLGAEPAWASTVDAGPPPGQAAARRAAERAEKDRARRAEAAAKDQAELDRILAKIARDGMGALSAREKKWLQRESERRRGA